MCIQANYRDNPFHNFRHCFCVTQMVSIWFMLLLTILTVIIITITKKIITKNNKNILLRRKLNSPNAISRGFFMKQKLTNKTILKILSIVRHYKLIDKFPDLQNCDLYREMSDSYPVAFRRRRGAAENYGKDELFPTILCVPLKVTGYESGEMYWTEEQIEVIDSSDALRKCTMLFAVPN